MDDLKIYRIGYFWIEFVWIGIGGDSLLWTPLGSCRIGRWYLLTEQLLAYQRLFSMELVAKPLNWLASERMWTIVSPVHLYYHYYYYYCRCRRRRRRQYTTSTPIGVEQVNLAVTLNTWTRKGRDGISPGTLTILTDVSLGIPQFLQADFRLGPQLGHAAPLCFRIHRSWLPSDVLCSEILR